MTITRLPLNATEVTHYGEVVGYYWPLTVHGVYRAIGRWSKPLGVYRTTQEAIAAIRKSAKEV